MSEKFKIFIFALLIFPFCALSQESCPPNIGFENGNFDNWKLYTGHIAESGTSYLDPAKGNQRLYSTKSFIEKDLYGNFDVAPPDGSIFCVKLGNDLPDQKIDRLTYSFTVPANDNNFSIVFNYAVVFQNADHEAHQQPRFTVKVFNVTKGEYIECSSFDFVGGYSQPDFLVSEKDRNVSYKPWSSAAMNLGAYAGETLQLEFTANDCTKGGHFGYAYFDITEKCSNSITGNIICAGVDDAALHAPENFASYEWYPANFSTLLGTENVYTAPKPNIGDSFAVVLVPYAYLGCRDTFYTKITSLSDTIKLEVRDTVNGCTNAGADITHADVTAGSSRDLQFSYYVDAAATIPVTDPANITTPGIYYVRATNAAGCSKTERLIVNISEAPVFTVTDPGIVKYPQAIDLTTLTGNASLNYTYWKNNNLTDVVSNATRVNESGIYYVQGRNAAGCSSVQPVEVKIEPVITVPNSFTPNGDGRNDRFVFSAGGKFKELSFFKVFNRHGRVIFNAKSASDSWDGTFNGKPVDTGTYIWMLKATDWLGKVHVANGTVVLVR